MTIYLKKFGNEAWGMVLFENIKQEKTYIIAEMSANHAGSLENAKKIIYAAKDAGADCIKIQTYTADTLTIDCDNKYFNIKNGTWKGEKLYHLYEKAYTPWEWQADLKSEAKKTGIDFLSTPFDRTSVDFLENLGVEAYKIASFELVDIPLVDYVASKGKPVILSTGMGSEDEINEAVKTIKKHHNQIVLMKCSSVYPAVPDGMNLATITDMKERFGCVAGFSDHSLGSVMAVAAVTMGAKVIEKHFCLGKDIKNPDSSFSMEPEEFAHMVQDIRMAEKAIGTVFYGPSGQEKDSMVFRKSVFVVNDIKAGDKFSENNIRVIRPGYGVLPKYYNSLLGKRAATDIPRGTPFSFSMVMK